MPPVSLGRMVTYVLSEHDVASINFAREHVVNVPNTGGNPVDVGRECVAIVVRTWSPTLANLKVMLDGHDTYWCTSRAEGTEPGTWHWPVRATLPVVPE